MTSATTEREEYNKKYEDLIQKMNFNSQQSSNDNEKLTSIMVHLIKQRCEQIGERIKCVYKFKSGSFI